MNEKEGMSAAIEERIAARTHSTYPKASQGDAVRDSSYRYHLYFALFGLVMSVVVEVNSLNVYILGALRCLSHSRL